MFQDSVTPAEDAEVHSNSCSASMAAQAEKDWARIAES